MLPRGLMSHKHSTWPKDMMSLMQDVSFKLFQKGGIASEKQGELCVCVCVRV